MAQGFRVPTLALAAALLTLLALLATLQYRWVGQISDAERDRMTATLNARAAAFAQDFDRELTRAYAVFQLDAPHGGQDALAAQAAERYHQWQETARFPDLIKQVYVASTPAAGLSLRAFDPATSALQPVDWPAGLDPIRAQIAQRNVASSPNGGTHVFVMRTIGPPVWPSVPAIVVPTALVFDGKPDEAAVRMHSDLAFTILELDRGVIERKMLPALSEQHFQPGATGIEYELAVVGSGSDLLYHSTPAFSPSLDTKADAVADLFSIRPQDFPVVASDVNRFAQFTQRSPDGRSGTVVRESVVSAAPEAPVALWFQTGDRAFFDKLLTALPKEPVSRTLAFDSKAPHWRLLVQHPAGSLEIAVTAARRRNLAISSGILVVLAISMGLLMMSTRRAQTLARQQLEFVATVSHELRTPLAVIRSAADNLADGLVDDGQRVRQYGQLVRREGLRLTDLVEQVLQFAGLESGSGRLDYRPVDLRAIVHDAATACTQAHPDQPSRIDLMMPSDLPPVRGDAAALRRVFQNLIGNAIKYGGADRWVGIRAVCDDDRVAVTVSDHGIGIASADRTRVFEPFYRTRDVVSRQIQGAGLGLSLVKRIVDAHGGRITLESVPGKGSSFTVTLAVAVDPAEAVEGSSEHARRVGEAASS